jgi:hypothetical protein
MTSWKAYKKKKDLIRLTLTIQAELKQYGKGSFDQALQSEIRMINSYLHHIMTRILEES